MNKSRHGWQKRLPRNSAIVCLCLYYTFSVLCMHVSMYTYLYKNIWLIIYLIIITCTPNLAGFRIFFFFDEGQLVVCLAAVGNSQSVSITVQRRKSQNTSDDILGGPCSIMTQRNLAYTVQSNRWRCSSLMLELIEWAWTENRAVGWIWQQKKERPQN